MVWPSITTVGCEAEGVTGDCCGVCHKNAKTTRATIAAQSATRPSLRELFRADIRAGPIIRGVRTLYEKRGCIEKDERHHEEGYKPVAVSYTHLRAHETGRNL